MRTSSIIVTLLVALVAATPTSAAQTTSKRTQQPAGSYATILLEDGTVAEPEQTWVRKARMPSNVGVIVLRRQGCPDRPERDCTDRPVWTGCPWDTSKTCRLWSRIFQNPISQTRRLDFFHELGHNVVNLQATATDHQRLQELVRDPRPWDQSPNSPREKSAVAWAACASFSTRTANLDFDYDYRPTRRRFKLICAVYRRMAKRYQESVPVIPWPPEETTQTSATPGEKPANTPPAPSPPPSQPPTTTPPGPAPDGGPPDTCQGGVTGDPVPTNCQIIP